ncbi:MAG: PD40 domain-containing protein [Planctomyces sp.]|nr:PD40 domain-containing protein [Planctomyces sp.]
MVMRLSRLILLAVLAAVLLDGAARGGEPAWTRLTTDGLHKQRPNWSPDGRRLMFTRQQGITFRLYELDIESGEERRLLPGDHLELDGVWSPDGDELALTLNKPQPNQSDVDVYRFRLADESLIPVAATEKKLSHEEYPSWSPDGVRLAWTSTRDGNQEVYTSRPDGTDIIRLTNDPAHDAHPAWSPNGDWIAFATDRWGDLEIAIIRPDGAGLRRLTASPGLDDFPVWSPDGLRLAFTSSRDGNREAYELEIASGAVRRRTFHAGIDDYPAWTPDGRLTVVSQREDGFDIYVESAP